MRRRSKRSICTLRASATETREIYRDDAGWPFDLTKLYDLPAAVRVSRLFPFRVRNERGRRARWRRSRRRARGQSIAWGTKATPTAKSALTNNWLRQDDPRKAPYVRSTMMVSFGTGENFSFDSLNNQAQGNDIALRQAFVEAGNVFQTCLTSDSGPASATTCGTTFTSTTSITST